MCVYFSDTAFAQQPLSSKLRRRARFASVLQGDILDVPFQLLSFPLVNQLSLSIMAVHWQYRATVPLRESCSAEISQAIPSQGQSWEGKWANTTRAGSEPTTFGFRSPLLHRLRHKATIGGAGSGYSRSYLTALEASDIGVSIKRWP